MKEIQLTQDQVALVDDKDFEWLSQWKWSAAWDNWTKSFYAVRTDVSANPHKSVKMARLIMETPKGTYCDHINHNTLDNQRENLRNVTNAQNGMNRKKFQANNDLGILGVCLNGTKFMGYISVNGKQVYFPTRDTLEEAIADRKDAEVKYYGEYHHK